MTKKIWSIIKISLNIVIRNKTVSFELTGDPDEEATGHLLASERVVSPARELPVLLVLRGADGQLGPGSGDRSASKSFTACLKSFVVQTRQ